MLEEKSKKIIVIAIIAGTLSGLLGSPGFAIIVPLLFMMGVTENFNVALGIFFMGIVLPDMISSIMYYYKNAKDIDLVHPLLFTVVFTVMSALAIYFSEYFHTNHKFFLAGSLQLFIGVWYILYGYHKLS